MIQISRDCERISFLIVPRPSSLVGGNNMPPIIYHILLGIIQGLTEFIPVSSSAHLVIAQHIFGLKEPQIFFGIVLHLGTLLAVVIYFYKDILDIIKSLSSPRSDGFRLFILLVIGTIPTAILGFFLKGYFKLLFSSPVFSAIFLIITGIILFLTRFIKRTGKDIRAFSYLDAIIIGVAQTIAIAPGISRSGITISAGIFRGIDRKLCARYSLLLSIPAVIGALLSEIKEVGAIDSVNLIYMSLGFVSSFLVGCLAITILVKCLQKARFYMFAYYCWIVGIFAILVNLL